LGVFPANAGLRQAKGGISNSLETTSSFSGQDKPEPRLLSREEIRGMMNHCAAYKGSDVRRSAIQLGTTALLFCAALACLFQAYAAQAWWLCAALLLPAAGLLIRLFIVQHDCGHGSYFPSRRMNDLVGRMISVLTFTPYDLWRRTHNLHHAGSGNLDRRGSGSVDTLTISEYMALSPGRRRFYRFYRHPLILLVLGPPLYVLFIQRLPPADYPFVKDYHSISPSQSWRSIMGLNLALAVFYGMIGVMTGWSAVLLYLGIVVTAFWIGQWLFFVQHQFESTHWRRQDNWGFAEAALYGSSYYELPRILQWFTGNIGFHHIHHLCAAIPNYRLQACHDDHSGFGNINRINIRQSLKSIRLALWDEEQERMVRFSDLPSGL
jgi:omega-6 fatty acid desaturase (delta-12 desaturase)